MYFFSPSIPFGYLSTNELGSGAYSGFGIDMHIYGFTSFLGYGISLTKVIQGFSYLTLAINMLGISDKLDINLRTQLILFFLPFQLPYQ